MKSKIENKFLHKKKENHNKKINGNAILVYLKANSLFPKELMFCIICNIQVLELGLNKKKTREKVIAHWKKMNVGFCIWKFPFPTLCHCNFCHSIFPRNQTSLIQH
jgi:hypothetical protein